VSFDVEDGSDIVFWKEILTPQVQLPAAQPQLAQEQEALPQPPAIVVDVELVFGEECWWMIKGWKSSFVYCRCCG
jgi:hypothetical protein